MRTGWAGASGVGGDDPEGEGAKRRGKLSPGDTIRISGPGQARSHRLLLHEMMNVLVSAN